MTRIEITAAEIGRVYVTRCGFKAVVHQEVDVVPPWWRMRDERGFGWLAKANGRALSRVAQHPLDLVERTTILVRDIDRIKYKGPAPDW